MPIDLPDEFESAFSVAEALRAGVPASRLRRVDLGRPFRGMRTAPNVGTSSLDPAPDLDPATDHAAKPKSAFELAREAVVERARHFAVIMLPHEFFSHVTAAILWDLWLPFALVRDHAALDVAVCAPARHPRRAGVAGHQTPRRFVHVVTHPTLGVRLASPASTWAQLASVIGDPYDLVAAGDAAVREPMFEGDPPALATPAQLARAIAEGRRAGITALRTALPRVRTRSASRPETRCRLLLVDAGLPEPRLNWNLLDAHGNTIACIDLAYPELKIAVEYEGQHHLRDSAQWTKDIARYELLAAHGWLVIRITKDALFSDPQSIVERVRAARALRAAR